MNMNIPGIHHITAVTGHPQKNYDFYAGVLGLRLVKRTVNFDDPGTYHLYFGDDLGRPGTILTFFPWPDGKRGRQGAGQATSIRFAIPREALDFWRERLDRHGVSAAGPVDLFGEPALIFHDPDGLPLELIGVDSDWIGRGRTGGPIEASHAIGGFHSVVFTESKIEPTESMLIGVLGLSRIGDNGRMTRFAMGGGRGPGAVVDVIADPDARAGLIGVGAIHHVALRAIDAEVHKAWASRIAAHGLAVTPTVDRKYFQSIYFHEPGGALLELATDPPGFTVDEDAHKLGETLALPKWLEQERPIIERALPSLDTKKFHEAA